MIRRAATSVTAAVVMTMLAGCTTAAVGHAELQVQGTWSDAPDGPGVIQMVVTDGTGTSFTGEVTYRSRAGEETRPASAEMTPNGHLVIEVGDDVSVEAHITDSTTLDYCLVTYGNLPTYACGRLVRAD